MKEERSEEFDILASFHSLPAAFRLLLSAFYLLLSSLYSLLSPHNPIHTNTAVADMRKYHTTLHALYSPLVLNARTRQ